MNNSSFTCDCSPGWTGTRCEINVNECSPNPCLNDGKCIDLINRYQCICPPGFTGERCQDGKFNLRMNLLKMIELLELTLKLRVEKAGTIEDFLTSKRDSIQNLSQWSKILDNSRLLISWRIRWSQILPFRFSLDIDECRLGHSLTPCISSTTESCENQMGSFKCNCLKGFSGTHCEHSKWSLFSSPINCEIVFFHYQRKFSCIHDG